MATLGGVLLIAIAAIFISWVMEPGISEPSTQVAPTVFPGGTQDQDFVPIEDRPIVTTRNFSRTEPGITMTTVSSPSLISDLVVGNPSEEFNNLVSELFLDVFWVEECSLAGETSARAVILTAQPNVQGELDDARNAVAAFEPSILYDLGTTLYPNIADTVLKNVDVNFTKFDSFTRVASFDLGGSEAAVYHSWVLNFPVFATSHQCLVAAINDLYSPHAH